ncbi:MAG: histidine phosphatase family protein, partial [Acidobacteria bacterium]|nr:histidine phosphatase family protein [Acidobacteriota bacterium]
MTRRFCTALLIACVSVLVLGCSPQPQSAPDTRAADEARIYLLRHAEFDTTDPEKMLSQDGRGRAAALTDRFKDVKVDYVFASHTLRTRDTVAPLAEAHGLKVEQFPSLGSTLEGEVIDNRTSGGIAAKPLLQAIQQVADGSTVVVAGNSGNLYAVMAGLGVRVSTTESPCEKSDASCLPCADK